MSGWKDRSDDELVEAGGAIGGTGFQGLQLGPLIEMERRLKDAIKDFNQKSSEQTSKIKNLTWAIAILTGIYTLAAIAQVWLALLTIRKG